MAIPFSLREVAPMGTTVARFVARLLVVMLVLTTGMSGVWAQPNQLVVNAFGGEYEEIFKRSIKEPFEREFGTRIVFDSTGSASEDYAKIRATRGDPGWDVVVMTAPESILGCRERLLDPLTDAAVPNLKALYPEVQKMVAPCGVAHEIQYMTLMYNTNHVRPAPDSWKVFWDPRYKGRLIIPDIGSILAVYFLIMASYAHGGDERNIAPGFDAIARLRPNALAVIQSSAAMVPYVEREEAWLLPYWDGRAHYYRSRGLPVDFLVPKEGSIFLLGTLNVPANARNKPLAYKFVNWWLSAEVQRRWALAYTVGSARGGISFPTEHRQAHISSIAQVRKFKFVDPVYVGDKRPEWTETWKRVMVGR
ncbi:MAG: ABC transporter substrate-binding protein [Armatimonadota bacterium]|nr:ABC transporter substrate-binding protein [Armatimonadota bacterium]